MFSGDAESVCVAPYAAIVKLLCYGTHKCMKKFILLLHSFCNHSFFIRKEARNIK